MANVIKLRKGLDINLKGKAAEEFMSVKEPGFVRGGSIPQCFTEELFQLMVIPSPVFLGALVMGILSAVRMDVVIC